MMMIKSILLILGRRGNRAFGQEFMSTHDPVGYIPSDLGSVPSSQISIPFIPSATGPFTQDLSQSSVINRKNYKQHIDSQSQSRYIPGSSTFANHAFGWGNSNTISSQNFYSSQASMGLALSQSDRLRLMSEMASQSGPNNNNNSNGNNGNGGISGLMSQDGFAFDDYKSQDISALSQDFDLRSQASQAYTQY